MPLKQDTGTDFASILNAASRLPEAFSDAGKDLPDGFPANIDPTHRVVDSPDDGISGVVAFDFKIHRRVFTIFRLWDSCARCGQAIAQGDAALPDEGDYECPHTALAEYEDIVNSILAGKMIFGSEQEITQKDGSVLISLRWYEKIDKKKKAPRPGIDGTVPEPSL